MAGVCAGEHDHRNVRERGVAPLLTPKCPAVYHGHPQVQDDNARRTAAAQIRESGLPVFGGDDREPVGFEAVRQYLSHRRLVIDDQNGVPHAASLRR
jgi:hypothetical protein